MSRQVRIDEVQEVKPIHSPAVEKRKWPVSHIWPILFGALIGILWVYREFFISRGNLIAGDSSDSRFLIATMEHWLNALLHGAALRSPPFFYPEPGVLGYSDSLLLMAPVYGFFRILGFDYFLAYEFVLFSLTALSYVGVYLLFKHGFGFQPAISMFAALLFTCSSMTYIAVVHAQLLSVAVAPAILGMAVAGYRAAQGGMARRGRVFMALAGLLLGLEAATCYYIAWSIVFLGFVFAAILVAILAVFPKTKPDFRASKLGTVPILAFVLGFGAGLIPFLYIYVPAYLRLRGGYSFGAAYEFLPGPQDFFNTGRGNFLWGWLVHWLSGDRTNERFFGWPPGLVLAACIAGVAAFVRLRSRSERILSAVVASGVLTWLAGYLVVVRFGPHTLWNLVYRFVPGTGGARVPQRLDMVTNLFVCLAAAYFLRWLAGFKRTGVAAACVLAPFFLVEQLNMAPSHRLDRLEESGILDRVQAPPASCGVFYIARPALSWRWPPTTQIDAMLTAERFHVPTVNGYSGNFPKSWDLMDLKGDYQAKALARALSDGSVRDVCGLDMETGLWKLVRKDPVEIIFGRGFSPQEQNDRTFWRWVDGREGILDLSNNTVAPLTAQFRTIVNPAATAKARFDLTIGDKPESLMISRGQVLERTIHLPPGRTEVRIKCYGPQLAAPNDHRYLVFDLEGWKVSVP